MLSVLILFPKVVSAWPVRLSGVLYARQTSAADQAPIAASSDLWASVITNVAPIMTLVGERNAKEFLRVSSSHDQLFLMATAPLGLLSLMICAIRLSGRLILLRLTGREADPKSEALVEMTPLSVAPATSVYTKHAVEIKPSEQRDEAAFVYAHIKQTDRVLEALASFKHILRVRVDKVKGDSDGNASTDQEDYELVLGMKRSLLTADQTARIVTSILDETREIEESLAKRVESTSLSFRRTGISPTQTAATTTSNRRLATKLPNLGNVLAGICSFTAMGGVQIAGYYSGGPEIGNTGLKTLTMGLVGYCGIAVFTFILLVIIKQEVEIEPQDLDPIFDDANVIWTFSDSRHAQHQAFDKPHHRNLVQASLKKQLSSGKRQVITSFVSAGLMGSYVVYYLGVRVAVWWVAFGELLIVWFSAVFRAWVIRGFLRANDGELGEHWLGIFRDDLSESLLETVAIMEHKTANSNASKNIRGKPVSSSVQEKVTPLPSSASSKFDNEKTVSSPVPEDVMPFSSPKLSKIDSDKTISCSDGSIRSDELEAMESLTGSCTLVVVKPIRQSLRNWSGCEDIMKVALEMAKHVCRFQIFGNPGYRLDILDVPSFKRIIRFRLMVYVPGVLWRANTDLDYVLTEDLDLPNLYRDILKIFHLCNEVNGTITRHKALTKESSAKVSNVLCGPVAPIPHCTLPDGCEMTLTDLLVKLRSQNPDDMKAYTLDQSLLLPTIQLATMYESYRDDRENLFSRIQEMQNGHTDKLRLSGGKHLPTLEAVFEEHKIWQHFMEPRPEQEPSKAALQPRDATSGLYGKPARRKATKREKRKERFWLQDMAFRNRPGNPGQ